jgi:hypothetical protein
MFNIPVSTKQILITLIKWWIFIWVQLTLLILCWYRGPGTGVPGPSQKVRGKSTGRAVRWRNSSRCPTLGIKGLYWLYNASTGWWLTYPSEKWWSESQLGWWHSAHSQHMESHKSHVPNHQPVNHLQYAPKIFKASNC